MRYLAYLLLIFVLGCSLNNQENHTSINDSIEGQQLLHSLDSVRSSITIKTTNITLQNELDSANILIDKYQLIIKTQQPGELELQLLKTKIISLKKNNLLLVRKIDSLNKKNQELIDSNLIATQKITDKQKLINDIRVENINLHESLNRRHSNFQPLLSCVMISPCGFRHSKPIITHEAKEVKRIEIRCIVNPNPRDEEKRHNIKVQILKALGFKGLSNSFMYSQEPDYKKLVTFDNIEVFIPGEYLIKITIDDEQVFLSTLVLK